MVNLNNKIRFKTTCPKILPRPSRTDQFHSNPPAHPKRYVLHSEEALLAFLSPIFEIKRFRNTNICGEHF